MIRHDGLIETQNMKYTRSSKPIQNLRSIVPNSLKSLSVLINPATKALGNAWIHSFLLKSDGMELKTLFKRFSLEYIAAAEPLCPSKSCMEEIKWARSASRGEPTFEGPVNCD